MAKRFSDEEGFALILSAFLLFAIICFTSFAIDIGKSYMEQRRIHLASDAGAFAGAKVLIDPTVPSNTVVAEARALALANGLTDAELSAGEGIDVGRWQQDVATNQWTFTEGATPANAVRVDARRTVPTSFSRMLGWTSLAPSAMAIGAIGSAGSATCMIPFGAESSLLSGKNYGDVLYITNDSAGNWGKLNIGGNMSSGTNFQNAMQNGTCNVTTSVGELIDPGTGFAQVRQQFQSRLATNPRIVFPAVVGFGTFQGSSGSVRVAGFVAADIVSVSGTGSNWIIAIRLVEDFVGMGGGGPNNPPFGRSRVLVQ